MLIEASTSLAGSVILVASPRIHNSLKWLLALCRLLLGERHVTLDCHLARREGLVRVRVRVKVRVRVRVRVIILPVVKAWLGYG